MATRRLLLTSARLAGAAASRPAQEGIAGGCAVALCAGEWGGFRVPQALFLSAR